VGAPLPAAISYDPSPDFGSGPAPFIVMMVAGFAIGVVGHVVRARAWWRSGSARSSSPRFCCR
jgi:hypothetical protein